MYITTKIDNLIVENWDEDMGMTIAGKVIYPDGTESETVKFNEYDLCAYLQETGDCDEYNVPVEDVYNQTAAEWTAELVDRED